MTTKTEAKWQAIIQEQERSGRTVREFAAHHGFAAGTLFWWRSRLRRGQRAGETQLVPVEVVETTVDQSAAIELVIRDGLVLRLPRGFDDADLRRVLAAVGKC